MHENGPPAIRCPECNYKAPRHSAFCCADETRQPATSAERYRDLEVGGPFSERAQSWEAPAGSGDVCGPAAPSCVGTLAPDPRPQGERYYPLDRGIPDEAFGRGPAMDALSAVEAHNAEQRSELIAAVSGLDPIADARARAVTEGLNPKDLVGAVKTPLGLLPWTALVQVAGVFAVGAEKYGAYNWRTKGQPVQHVTYVEAAFRHLAAYMDGQTIDPETGCNHLAHAACGLLILLDASAVGNSIDNRPTPGHAAEIMAIRREV